MTTGTPRTIFAMSLKKNDDLSEKDCLVYENYVHADVCAQIERELTASKAEVERLLDVLRFLRDECDLGKRTFRRVSEAINQSNL